MKSFTLFVGILLIGCQTHQPLQPIASLPKSLYEVSGMVYDTHRDAFWMHTDSGNNPELFLVSKQGNVLKSIEIDTLQTDWEAMALDSQGVLYVGDIGNNANDRKQLSILTIPLDSLSNAQNPRVSAIHFYYPEQKAFPPDKKHLFFDAESLIVYQGSLYLFTKSRVQQSPGITHLYKIPTIPNSVKHPYAAQYISSFEGCPDAGCQITDADISKDSKKVVLLSHSSAWIFEDFENDNFFSGTVKQHSFHHTSQKEAVSFVNDSTLFIADEKSKMTGGKLYRFSLKGH